jgi:hypothetical protein
MHLQQLWATFAVAASNETKRFEQSRQRRYLDRRMVSKHRIIFLFIQVIHASLNLSDKDSFRIRAAQAFLTLLQHSDLALVSLFKKSAAHLVCSGVSNALALVLMPASFYFISLLFFLCPAFRSLHCFEALRYPLSLLPPCRSHAVPFFAGACTWVFYGLTVLSLICLSSKCESGSVLFVTPIFAHMFQKRKSPSVPPCGG